jgi:hypothetical protein
MNRPLHGRPSVSNVMTRPLAIFVGGALAVGVCSGLVGLGGSAGVAGASQASVRHVATAKKSTSKKRSTTTTTIAPTTTTTASVTPSTTVSQADTWLLKAIGAEANLGSVEIKGNIDQKKSQGGNIVLALHVNGDGEGGGSFVQEGATIQLKRVGPLLYFNAPRKYWASHATAAQTKEYGGKWIEVSALDSRFTSFDQFLNAGDIVAAVFEGHTTPLTLSKITTYEGKKVYIVGDSITVKGKKTSGQMYISAKGTPYVLKIIDRGPGENSTIYFSGYGKAKSILTPPEPINLS